EIPLLLVLGSKLEHSPARGAYLLLDSSRHLRSRSTRLDNRYALGEEDVPAFEHLTRMGVTRARAWAWSEPAEDLTAYLEYLRASLAVTMTADVERKVAVSG